MLAALAGPARAEDKVLRILGWEGYMDESVTKDFTARTGWQVAATYAGTSDEMYAKIKAGGGATYDVVTASGDLTRRLYDSGLLEKLDLAKVPNYGKLFPLFQRPAYNTFDGAPYGVSIAWGPDFLIYDASVVKTPPESWNVLYDPAYASRISLNDYAIIIADVALWVGKPDIFKLGAKDLAEVKPKLLALKPQIRKFWTSQGELAQLFLNKEIALAWGWPVTVRQLEKEGFPVGATIPKEGTTGWSDSWMVLEGSPNAAAAHAWMDYMLEGEPQKKMTAVSGYWPVSSLITPLLSEAERKAMHIEDLEAYFAKVRFWETVPNYDEWTALWNELAASSTGEGSAAPARGAGFWALLGPPLAWLVLLYFVPLALLLAYAFMHHEYVRVVPTFTLENFGAIFGLGVDVNVGYRNTLLRTLGVAGLVTAIDLALAFPVAYFLVFHAGRWKRGLTLLVLLPLWSSYLVRVFAWRIILGYNGVLNKLLLLVGVLEAPSQLFLYNQFSVVLTLCYVWLPFMVLPLVTAFERLPVRLLEAAADLGARPATTFRRVALPLLMPGVLAGGLSVFSLTMGDYITPQMVGGSGEIMVGNLVASQFGVAANWPLGAAFAVVVLVTVLGLMAGLARGGALESL